MAHRVVDGHEDEAADFHPRTTLHDDETCARGGSPWITLYEAAERIQQAIDELGYDQPGSQFGKFHALPDLNQIYFSMAEDGEGIWIPSSSNRQPPAIEITLRRKQQ